MRKSVLAAAGLAILLAVSPLVISSATPAQAMAISAPAALKGASDGLVVTEPVHCWDCGYYEPRRYYRPYRPYYRPYYRSYNRPYYRSYSYDDGPYYRRYRPAYRSYWGGGYDYDSYRPRPRFFVGPNVYWY